MVCLAVPSRPALVARIAVAAEAARQVDAGSVAAQTGAAGALVSVDTLVSPRSQAVTL